MELTLKLCHKSNIINVCNKANKDIFSSIPNRSLLLDLIQVTLKATSKNCFVGGLRNFARKISTFF